MQEVLCDEHRKKRRKISGNDFYKDVLGSPKLVVAPMVEQSELVRLLSYVFGTNSHHLLHIALADIVSEIRCSGELYNKIIPK